MIVVIVVVVIIVIVVIVIIIIVVIVHSLNNNRQTGQRQFNAIQQTTLIVEETELTCWFLNSDRH